MTASLCARWFGVSLSTLALLGGQSISRRLSAAATRATAAGAGLVRISEWRIER